MFYSRNKFFFYQGIEALRAVLLDLSKRQASRSVDSRSIDCYQKVLDDTC